MEEISFSEFCTREAVSSGKTFRFALTVVGAIPVKSARELLALQLGGGKMAIATPDGKFQMLYFAPCIRQEESDILNTNSKNCFKKFKFCYN